MLAVAMAAAGVDSAAEEPLVTGTHTLTLQQGSVRDGRGPAQSSDPRGVSDLNVTLGWPREFDAWWVEFGLRADDRSSSQRGASLTNFSLKRENGEARIPYRVLAGDFTGTTSAFTSVRSIKGAWLEVQPLDRAMGVLHSVAAFAGKDESGWRDLRSGDDHTVGLSWVVQPVGQADVHGGVHLVRNSRAADEDAPVGRHTQSVAGITASAPLVIGATEWRMEGELARARGDAAPGATDAFSNRSGTAAYALLAGAYEPMHLQWSVEGERNGPGYGSYASAASGDQRRFEAKAMWAWQGWSFDVRRHLTRELAHAAEARDERGWGATLLVPLAPMAATWRSDAWRKVGRRLDGSSWGTEEHVESSLEMNALGAVINLGASLHDDEDLLDHASDRRTRELSIVARKPFQWRGWKVEAAPRFTWTRVHEPGVTQRRNVAGGDLTFTRDHHHFGFKANGNSFHPALEGQPDVARVVGSAEYKYSRGRHAVTFGYTATDVRTRPGLDTRSYTGSILWTVKLDRLPRQPRAEPAAAFSLAPAPLVDGAVPKNTGALVAVPLGALREGVARQLGAFGRGTAFANTWVYDVSLLFNLAQRQRLAVVYDASERVENVALLVRLDNATAAEVTRAYDRVLRDLIQRFGRPDSARQEGAIRESYANDFATGKVLRYAEWRLAEGGVLRVGIPPRLDGRARIEIQRAARLGDAATPGWALEAID